MKKFDYSLNYKEINIRENKELYKVWKWEQGVLLIEPYKSEILPFWKFKNREVAEKSSEKIYELFLDYKEKWDFIGMDMSRKFLQMWWTRARRYANHKSWKKYSDTFLENGKKIEKVPEFFDEKNKKHFIKTKTKKIIPQEKDALTNEKAISAEIFYKKYKKVLEDKDYIKLRKEWKEKFW